MVRDDWGQYGTAMKRQSAAIRDWLGSPPYVFATADRKTYESDDSADREFMTYVAHDADERHAIDLSDLNKLRRADTLTPPLIVLTSSDWSLWSAEPAPICSPQSPTAHR